MEAAATPTKSGKGTLLCVPFMDVVDAQSARYEVPAMVMQSVLKPVQNFYKVVALVVDEKCGRMFCEAIGSQTEMSALQKKLEAGKPFLFRRLCFKRSIYVSGGKYLDLSKKQNVSVEHLPPTHSAYGELQRALRRGPTTMGDIAGLQGLEKGSKADLLCKTCTLKRRTMKEVQEIW